MQISTESEQNLSIQDSGLGLLANPQNILIIGGTFVVNNILPANGAYKGARNPKRTAREMGRPLRHHPYLYQTQDANSHEDAMQEDGNHRARLAPLQYLQAIPPRRRRVVDEMALIQLSKFINFSSSHALHCHLSESGTRQTQDANSHEDAMQEDARLVPLQYLQAIPPRSATPTCCR